MHLSRYGWLIMGHFQKKKKKVKILGENIKCEFQGLGPGETSSLKFSLSALNVIHVPIQLHLHKLDLPFPLLLLMFCARIFVLVKIF